METTTGLQQNQPLPHHIQHNLCTNRPQYRQGRKLTAVKVYTVASESQHLFIYGVPKISLRSELKAICVKYGQIHKIHVVKEVETEAFTECYHIHYQRIQSARIAKRFLDNKSFYGGHLHVCYAPEYESIHELKYKFEQRRYDVLKRLCGEAQTPKPSLKEIGKDYKNLTTNQVQVNRKRKRPAVEITDERMAGVDPLLAWKDVPKELDPRIKTNVPEVGVSIPQKHYQTKEQIEENINHNESPKRAKVLIATRKVYGPQLPCNEVLNQGSDDTVETSFVSSLLVPTQVVLSKEYTYKHKTQNTVKRIVFRDNPS